MKKASVVLVLFLLISCFYQCSTDKAKEITVNILTAPFERLSAYHFFVGNLAELKPNKGLLPYDLISPLFSDYAHKKRFIWVPKGKKATYSENEVLKFPIGTVLIKNFYYPKDFRDESLGRDILETRLLIHKENGWEALEYIWNEEQTDAYLEIAGGDKLISWIDKKGKTQKLKYSMPNKIQCKGCHSHDNKLQPIGPKVRNLNKDFTYTDHKQNQLKKWMDNGLLESFNFSNALTNANYEDKDASLNARARAYLDINCGHCHNPKGPANTSGLNLMAWECNLTKLGFCKSPIAAGKGAGGHKYDILPSKATQSILWYRMQSTDPGIMMPEVGRKMRHQEGLNLIKEWINSLEGTCQ